MLVATCTAGCSTSSTGSVPGVFPAGALSPTPASRAMPNQAGPGDTVEIKGTNAGQSIEVTLTKFIDPAPPRADIVTPAPGTRFVAVQLRIINTGTSAYTDDPRMEIKAKNAAGQSLDPTFDVTAAGPSMASNVNLTPGGDAAALGFFTFKVPTGQKITEVQFADHSFAGNIARWDIG